MKNIKPLISAKDIEKKIKKIASQINKDFKNKDLIIVAVLTGSVIFCCDIIRKLNINFFLDFVRVASYKGRKSSNKISLLSSNKLNVKNKDVLIIEDIYDSGQTLDFIKKLFTKQKAKSIKTCVLVNKNIEKSKTVNIDYSGFTIEDKFIVGYGLDYDGKYRGLPYIGILKEVFYEKQK